MSEKKNVFQKLLEARVLLDKKELKATGHSDFGNYDYLELGDFSTELNEINLQLGLCPIINFKFSEEGKMTGVLTLYNADDANETLVFECQEGEFENKKMQGIQEMGSKRTFITRYLYVSVYNIAENDSINRSDPKDKTDPSEQPISKSKIATIQSMIEKAKVTKESVLNGYGVTEIDQLNTAQAMACITALNNYIKQNGGK